MVKRSLAAATLLFMIACGEVIPTKSNRTARTAVDAGITAVRKPTADISAADVAAIEIIDPSSLTITGSISLDGFPTTETNQEGVIDVEGGAIAERFSGQNLSFNGDFDVLTATAGSPLSLQAGATNQNLMTWFYSPAASKSILGLGWRGYPAANAIGEGSIAVLFDEDQSELGFAVAGVNGGSVTAKFFRRDGSLIQTSVLQLSASGNDKFAFRRADGVRDIGGVSLENDDLEGVTFYEFRTAQPTASETTQPVPQNAPAEVTVKDENGNKVAGIKFPEFTYDQDVTVNVRLEHLDAGEKCHNYLIGQRNECLEITVRNSLNQPVINKQAYVAGACLPQKFPLEFFKFEDPNGRAVPLKETPADFLDCNAVQQVGSRKPSNWFEGLAMGITRQVGRWVTPKSAYASDQGFGGEVSPGHGTSFFVWASPLRVLDGQLVPNVRNTQLDAFTVAGTFDPFSSASGFNPALPAGAGLVTVGYGDYVEPAIAVLPSTFKYSTKLKKYVYTKSVSVGVNYMDIDPTTGGFSITGNVPTQGPLPTSRGLTVQLDRGTKTTSGVTLLCNLQKRCVPQHPQ